MDQQILNQIKVIAQNCAKKLEMEIISVEYVKEFGAKILRIIASKEPTMDIDDSSNLNRLISDELDKVDLIEEEYFLEVSSEGLEKELRTNDDIKKSIGEYICIGLYEKIEGKKELYGDLISYIEDKLIINVNIKGQEKQLTIDKDKISKIRLAVKF